MIKHKNLFNALVCSIQQPWLLLLILPTFAIHLCRMDDRFAFRRTEIVHGELWRLFTGHLSHLGNAHFLENTTALLIIGLIFGQQFTTRFWLFIYCLCALTISFLLLTINSEIEWYVGLSGILHGFFVAGLVKQIRHNNSVLIAWMALVMVIAKLTWEQFVGPIPGTEQLAGGRVIVASHLYGALAGLVGALVSTTGPVENSGR